MAVLYQNVIAVFDDSFQPTGVEWEGLVPHLKMKKLRHELTITVEGPEDLGESARTCLQEAGIAGLVAAVAAAFIGAGIGATGPAWAAFQAAFVRCAGNQVSLHLDDNSHWIEWRT